MVRQPHDHGMHTHLPVASNQLQASPTCNFQREPSYEDYPELYVVPSGASEVDAEQPQPNVPNEMESIDTYCTTESVTEEEEEQDEEEEEEVRKIKERLTKKYVETFRCIGCNEIPRPRFNQIEFVTCPANHVLCTTCAMNNPKSLCSECNERVSEWRFPTETEPLLKKLYQELCKKSRFPCYRNCGLKFKGCNSIIKHDRVCRSGRELKCPFDSKPLIPYTGDAKKHTHVINVLPYKNSRPDEGKKTWSFVLNWTAMEASSKGNGFVAAYLLYMHEPDQYLRDRANGLDEPYSPQAAIVMFGDPTSLFIKKKDGRFRHQCTMTINWAESEPYNLKGINHKFVVREVKASHTSLHTKVSEIRPRYLANPPMASGGKWRSQGPANDNDTSLTVTTSHLGKWEDRKKFTCSLCSVKNVWHSHFNLTLKQDFNSLPTGQTIGRSENLADRTF